MDIVIIIVGLILILVGMAGSFLPVLPGPPISYVALPLLYLHSTAADKLGATFLIVMGLVVIAVTVIDYYLPIWGTKRSGGSKAGEVGSIVGLIAGLLFLSAFLGPFAIIVGPFVGAVVGELTTGKEMNAALRSGWGSFVGFIAGVVLKMALCAVIGFYFIKLVWF